MVVSTRWGKLQKSVLPEYHNVRSPIDAAARLRAIAAEEKRRVKDAAAKREAQLVVAHQQKEKAEEEHQKAVEADFVQHEKARQAQVAHIHRVLEQRKHQLHEKNHQEDVKNKLAQIHLQQREVKAHSMLQAALKASDSEAKRRLRLAALRQKRLTEIKAEHTQNQLELAALAKEQIEAQRQAACETEAAKLEKVRAMRAAWVEQEKARHKEELVQRNMAEERARIHGIERVELEKEKQLRLVEQAVKEDEIAHQRRIAAVAAEREAAVVVKHAETEKQLARAAESKAKMAKEKQSKIEAEAARAEKARVEKATRAAEAKAREKEAFAIRNAKEEVRAHQARLRVAQQQKEEEERVRRMVLG